MIYDDEDEDEEDDEEDEDEEEEEEEEGSSGFRNRFLEEPSSTAVSFSLSALSLINQNSKTHRRGVFQELTSLH